jgi:uncharacterized protein
MQPWLDAFAVAVSEPTFGLIAAAAFIGGFLRGFIGFGGALVLVLVLAAVQGPTLAVPVTALAGLPVMFQLLPTAIRLSERAMVIPFGLASFLGAPLGAWVLVTLNPALMKIAVALFVIIMVVMLYRGWRISGGMTRVHLAIAGVLAGFIQGSSSVGGPPAVAVALSHPGTPQQQRANTIGAVTALNLCSLVPLWWHGLFTQQVVVLGLLLVPTYSAATWLGQRFFSERGQRYYTKSALIALAAIGLVTLAFAVSDYLGE